MSAAAGDNSLPDLAARIRAEHGAAVVSLGDALRHAMSAGDLLLEAKAQVRHGQWLPWLTDHCSLSERTCQLYMRVAKNRAEIEAAKAQSVAGLDLTLKETAALLMLSSDVRKVLSFARTAEELAGEELVDFCIANDVGIVHDPSYDPFAGRSEAEKLEWLIFTLFLTYDPQAGRGCSPEGASSHVEWLLQRPFQNVEEWLGPEGDEWRRVWSRGHNPDDKFKAGWGAFRDAHREATLADLDAEREALEARFEEAQAKGLVRRRVKRRQKRNALRI